MKKIISVVCLLFALLMIASVPVGAAQAYQTYTYSIDGKALHSPDAYTAIKTVDSVAMGLPTDEKGNVIPLNNATDIVVDADENIYIVDRDNSRIVCLDKYFRLRKKADGSDMILQNFINGQGVPDKFSKPEGIYVTAPRRVQEGDKFVEKPGRIFVCDTQNARIVTFTLDGEFDSIIGAPQSNLLDSDAIYWPVAVAVDQYDRVFVVSTETNEGIIVMTDKGEFTGFIGAQQSVTSLWDEIWKRFQSEEQRGKNIAVTSYPYNNVAVNDRGFIYATIYAEDLESQMVSAITTNSKVGTYAPCKLLNPAGDEIMRRNGFWPPAGEVDIGNKLDKGYLGASRITDVACGPEQTWTLVDSLRNKLYTYDYDGNLLFAFGDKGTQLGNLSKVRSVIYQGDRLIVLDGENKNQKLIVYKRTQYGDCLVSALAHQNNREYEEAIDDWKRILMFNSNYDAAYIGIGQALYREGHYDEALDYYKAAYDTENYSTAYKELRKEWMSKFFLLIPVIVVVLVLLLGKFLRWVAKINKATAVSGKKRTFKEELLFVFHLMFHPFDAFWDLKHEKRGSVRAACVYIVLAIVALFYRSIGVGYVMNPQGEYSTIFMQILVVLVPFLLFVIANWCLTTLFEGEGSFKDIFIAVGYSLMPLVLTIIPTTIVSNFVLASETGLVSLIVTIGFIWTGFLIFFGVMVTHGYNIPKNLVTVLGTIVGMAFIMFLAILFTSLIMDIVSFVTGIISEIHYRL